MMSWSSRSVAFLAVTFMLMNSHSYWVLITSRDHSVASEELSLAWRRMSLAEVGDRRGTEEVHTHIYWNIMICFPHDVYIFGSCDNHQREWQTWRTGCSSECRRGICRCASCRCWPAPGHSGLQRHLYYWWWDKDSEELCPSLSCIRKYVKNKCCWLPKDAL